MARSRGLTESHVSLRDRRLLHDHGHGGMREPTRLREAHVTSTRLPLHFFVSYSHEDEAFVQRLRSDLSTMEFRLGLTHRV